MVALKELEMAVEEVPEEEIDVAFRKIGTGVSLVEDTSSEDKPPARALAVSNRYGLTFYATPSGFGIISTKELVELAKEPSSCVTSKSLVRIELEKIDIVELSEDELTLAICCGSRVRFYSVQSLIHKAEKNPFKVRDIGDDAEIQDFQWSRLEVDKCFVLSNKGSLLIGSKGEEFKRVKDNVAAACWNTFGKQIAYVVDMKLTISSVDFARSSTVDLPTEHPMLEDGLDFYVDSVRWISKSTMLVSYVQEEEDDEIACPLFALSATEQLNEESSDCKVFAIRAYSAIDASVSPSGTGPYMLVQNLDPWKFVITANRRSVDDHVVLLGWNSEETLCAYSLLNNSWRPEIPMYYSSDDNVLTGLCIDRTFSLQQSDPNNPDQLLPPSPILLCSLLDNRLCLYSILRLDGKEWYRPGLISPACPLDDLKESTVKDKDIDAKPLQRPAFRTGNRNNQPVRSLSSSFAAPVGNQIPGFSASKTVNEQRKALQSFDQEMANNSAVKQQTEPEKLARLPSVKSLPSAISSQQKIEETIAKKTVLSDMEAEIEKVRNMVEETEGMIWATSGGSCLTSESVEKLEKEVTALSTKCDFLKRNVKEKSQLVEELRDQSLDVDAWRIYVGSRVEQVSDSMYQDLWANKKLHPELEIKQRDVLSADEKLKKQISELESHLHTLELSQRQRQSNNAWQFQSVQSLYNTVNSQLEVAEKLFLHLGELMEMLNISPSVVPLRNRKVEKASVQNVPKTDKVPAKPVKLIVAEDLPLVPPESTRRRRDSIDGAWVGVGTTKATIKRISRSIKAESEKEVADSKRISPVLDKHARSLSKTGTVDQTTASVFRPERTFAFSSSSVTVAFSMKPGSSSPNTASEPPPTLVVSSTNASESSDIAGTMGTNLQASSKPSHGLFSISSATTAASFSGLSAKTESVAVASSGSSAITGTLPATSFNGSSVHTGTTVTASSKVPSGPFSGLNVQTGTTAAVSSTPTIPKQVPESQPADSSISIIQHQISAIVSAPKVSSSASTVSTLATVSAPAEAKPFSGLSFPSTLPSSASSASTSSAKPLPAEPKPFSGLSFPSTMPSSAFSASTSSAKPLPAETKPVSGLSFPSTMSSSASSASSASTSSAKPLPAFASVSSSSSQFAPVKTLPAFDSVPASASRVSPVNEPSSTFVSSTAASASSSSSTSSPSASIGFSFIPRVATSPSGNSSASTGSFSSALSISAEGSKPSGGFTFPSSFTAPLSSTSPSTVPALTSSIFKPQFSAASTTSAPSTSASGFGVFSIPAASSNAPLFGTISSTQSSSPFPALSRPPQQQQQQQQPSIQDAGEDMDEEAPSTSFSGFGLGSSIPSPSAARPNPFGLTSPQSAPLGSLSTPAGQLFRPAAFALPPASSSGPGFANTFQEGNPFPNPAAPVGGGFGQPSGFGQASQIGAGQAALGNALGAFGQTRQVGFGASVPGGTGISSSGGFATAASTAGGFQAFSQSGGFGGFAGAAGSGFGGFSSTFGSTNSAPKNELFTTMRK